MKRRLSTLLGSAVLLAWAAPAFAQVPFGQVPTARPTVSPFINLRQTGISPGVAYYGQVRPQLQFYGDINSLQQQVTANQQAIATGLGTNLANLPPQTGVAAGYQTHTRYFMTRGTRASLGLGGSGIGPAHPQTTGLAGAAGTTGTTGQPATGTPPTTGAARPPAR